MIDVQLTPPVSFILRQSGAFRRRLENLTPLWAVFDRTLHAIEEEQFASHGHGEWPGLADSTRAQKAAHGFSEDPLIRTGALRDSFDPLEEGPQTFVWGTGVEYAHWHQDGGYVAGRPPQRKVLDLRTEDRRKLEVELVAYINRAAAETWGRI